jgi:hypothetical protein
MTLKRPPEDDMKPSATTLDDSDMKPSATTFDDSVDERMAVFDRRTTSLQTSVDELTTMMRIMVARAGGGSSDGQTYASIAEVESELIQDKNEFLALTNPSLSTLAQLNTSPPRPAMALAILPNRQIRASTAASPIHASWPTEVESAHVTTRYSSGRSSLRPGMPLWPSAVLMEEAFVDSEEEKGPVPDVETVWSDAERSHPSRTDQSGQTLSALTLLGLIVRCNRFTLLGPGDQVGQHQVDQLDQLVPIYHTYLSPPLLISGKISLIMIWTQQPSMPSIAKSRPSLPTFDNWMIRVQMK